jgi:putative iron-regulated protein
MKRPLLRLTGLLAVTALVGCAVLVLPRIAAVKRFLAARTVHQVLADYAENNALKTIGRVVEDVTALNAAALRLKAEPSDANLAAAATAWRAARVPWKMGTAFMFGPAAYYNFDKQLSAWPPDRILIDHALSEVAAGRLQVDSRWLREGQTSTLRGFYAAEYLLFRNGQPRKAKELSPAELGYLAAVTQAMVEESIDYEASWRGSDNLAPAKAAVLKKAGLKVRSSFAAEFGSAGKPESRFSSAAVPLQEIFQDLGGVIEGVCPAIAELGKSPYPGDEYKESRNAYADLQAELQGAENAYLGGIKGSRGRAVSELVAAKDKVLDSRVQIAFAHTAQRLAAVGDPYGAPREGRALAVRIAEAECRKLAGRLNAATPLVTMDPDVGPWAAYGVKYKESIL